MPSENIVLSPPTFDRIMAAVEYTEKMVRAPIPGGVNGQRTGPVFPLLRQPAQRVLGAVGATPEEPPEVYGQVKMCLANLTWGASFLPLVNITPTG